MAKSRVIHADFVKWLRGNQWLAQNGHIDKYHAVLADPPYGLDFMSKGWDAYTPQNYQAWVTEWASMLLDYVHPGGVLMMFGGTRTYHRLVAGLEDAGWDIFDCVMVWTYGSGFPKSSSISKNIDKAAGVEREVVGQRTDGRYANDFQSTNNHMGQLNPKISNVHKIGQITAPATPEAAQWEGYGTSLKPSFEPLILARKPRAGLTYAQCALQFGSGALNIDKTRIMASKRDETKRHNRASIGYGGSNVPFQSGGHDAGRFPANTILIHHPDCNGACVEGCHVRALGEQSGESVSHQNTIGDKRKNDGQSIFLDGRHNPENSHGDVGTAARFFAQFESKSIEPRFRYVAKAAGWERDAGLDNAPSFSPTMGNGIGAREHDPSDTNAFRRNIHPTIKPIQLIEYIAKLLLPPVEDSRLLVPFSGSGSEMIGARLAGWNSITGIEMTDEYIPIAEARLKWWSQFSTYEAAQKASASVSRGNAKEEKIKATGQMSMFDLLPALGG